jgi:hypothetical protein
MTYRLCTLMTALVLAAAAGTVMVAAQAPHPSGGLGQGIKVHGHWVIEVRNPDGGLVERRQFDNALFPAGAVQLARFLGRAGSATRFEIQLGRYSLPNPCQGGTRNTSVVNECYIVDPLSTQTPTGTAVFPNLTTTIGGPNLTQVILEGHATALVAGQIQYVATRLGSCPSFTAPADCNPSGGGNYFTVHDLVDGQGNAVPLSVAARQIVQVTVVISFS